MTQSEKYRINRVCIDDFAIRKRYKYGTVMVELDTHRIVDILESRDSEEVAKWLQTYPNITVISRDGAQIYANASTRAHPSAIQVSDRFHLVKNLCDVVSKLIQREFPSRVAIPATCSSPEMQILYNTANQAERIQFAKRKRAEGYTISDIALMLHSSATTISRYLSYCEDDLPINTLFARQRQHEQAIQRKKEAIEEVRSLYDTGHNVEEISRLTGHTRKTVTNYLRCDCPLVNGHYDNRIPGKLAPYESYVINMRAEGRTYKDIHNFITKKGYSGTVSSLRMFMQKERARQKEASESETTEHSEIEYIQRKSLCKLIYSKLEDVSMLTGEQYGAAIRKYPFLGKMYSIVKEFHRIVFSHKPDEIETWISNARLLDIPELNTYLAGLSADLSAVKNAISYPYNNGLAEGSVNKIKLTKRIMYGRSSFALLRAKLLLNEQFN